MELPDSGENMKLVGFEQDLTVHVAHYLPQVQID